MDSVILSESAKTEVKKSPLLQSERKYKLLFIVFIVVIVILASALLYLFNQNRKLSEQLMDDRRDKITQSIQNLTPTPVFNSKDDQIEASASDELGQEVVDCKKAQSEFENLNSDHEFEVVIQSSEKPAKCKLINRSIGYSLLFDEGWITYPSGAIGSSALGFSSELSAYEQPDISSITVYRRYVTDESSLDLSKPESVIISFYADYPLVFPKNDKVSESVELIDINGKEVLEVSRFYTSINEYEKEFVVVDDDNRSLYFFSIYSKNEKFDDPEDLEMLEAVKAMISSFEVTKSE